ncbi:MAG: TetR/AcrR family transcriptional regulator [Luteibacter sp.]|uniref:TetR/AcrR family transcriptional regulator n=1 Tax=Luteibacter sp. TaxID=1886636 RepID=UPI0028071862|nr:TetR/AcrR family transcriptional regulator [Luteibacter sp.]MDQ7996726.1 TetR/AcrR family transcriptional regulator [Luteibacter sp.]MDQ8049721.1 TetR/AcrR family transcriptional regulator [Luteibacter sp.]
MTEQEPKWSRRKDARPQEIIEAAIDEFVAKGYANAKLADVARRAGVVKGTIYRYFETKADVFRAVARHLVTEHLSTIENASRSADNDVNTVLPMILSQVADRMSDPRVPGIVRMVLVEGRTFPDLAAVWHDEVIGKVAAFLTANIQRGQSTGSIREGDPALMLFSIMGPMLLGVLFRDTFPDSPLAPDLNALAAQHADLLRHGMGQGRT